MSVVCGGYRAWGSASVGQGEQGGQGDVLLLLLLLMAFKRHCLQAGRDRRLGELPSEFT